MAEQHQAGPRACGVFLHNGNAVHNLAQRGAVACAHRRVIELEMEYAHKLLQGDRTGLLHSSLQRQLRTKNKNLKISFDIRQFIGLLTHLYHLLRKLCKGIHGRMRKGIIALKHKHAARVWRFGQVRLDLHVGFLVIQDGGCVVLFDRHCRNCIGLCAEQWSGAHPRNGIQHVRGLSMMYFIQCAMFQSDRFTLFRP